MGTTGVGTVPGAEQACPFLRQYTTGTRPSICMATQTESTIRPDYVVTCCRVAQHVTCRRYLAVRGRHEAKTDVLATGQPLGPLSPAGSGTRAWTGLLAILSTILAGILVLIILQRVRLAPPAVGGTGPDPGRLPTGPAISASPRMLLPAVTPVPDQTPPPDLGQAVVDTGPGLDKLNLRQEPSRRASIIQTIGPGERLTLLEGPTEVDGETWWKVAYHGHTGWVAAAYVRRLLETSGRPVPMLSVTRPMPLEPSWARSPRPICNRSSPPSPSTSSG